MFKFAKNHMYTIGIDMGRDSLRLAQLVDSGGEIGLVAGCLQRCPAGIESGTPAWQLWAVDAIRESLAQNKFQGKKASSVIPASDVFIEVIKMPRNNDVKLEDAIYARIKQHLPSGCTRENTLIQHVLTDNESALVMAADREDINRYLAIYEKAGLEMKSIGVWPEALINSYVSFFGRRQSDVNETVLLLNMELDCTNLVICRHSNLLFARSLPIGAQGLDDERGIDRLVLDVTACRRDFVASCRNNTISRLIFLSGQAVERPIYARIAQQLEVQAQIGDCLVAVEMTDPACEELDRRDNHVSWATAFGLSMA
jgi:Tfp pilus assembly PilM family ATPase